MRRDEMAFTRSTANIEIVTGFLAARANTLSPRSDISKSRNEEAELHVCTRAIQYIQSPKARVSDTYITYMGNVRANHDKCVHRDARDRISGSELRRAKKPRTDRYYYRVFDQRGSAAVSISIERMF